MAAKPHVLILGAGIAGPVCAYFLSQISIRVTVIERAPALRAAGQQIDIRGAALSVVRRMNLEDTIRAQTTKEEGLSFVDGSGKSIADFPVDKEGGMSFTSDIEILRGTLGKVFYEASLRAGEKGGEVEYLFDDYVTGLEQRDGGVEVELKKGGKRCFDVVIGADGMGSKIRRLVFPEEKNALKSLGQYTAFFTIPFEGSDGTFAKWYNAPGGRCILLRPDNAGATRAYLSIMSSEPEGYYKMSMEEQKSLMRRLFDDAGWEAKRTLDGMDQADDFYMQEIAQVKIPSWSKGKVALLGDAGYCPSPISGMGTSLAIVGAYVLAGEIAKHGANVEEAMRGYERQMRPYVTKAQSLPPGAPALVNPQTWWGIKILNTVVGFVGWSGIATLIGKFSGPPGEDKSLPVYKFA